MPRNEYDNFVKLGPDPVIEKFLRRICNEYHLKITLDGTEFPSERILAHIALRSPIGLKLYEVVRGLYDGTSSNRS